MVARGRWWDQDRAAAGKSVAFKRYADFFAYLPPARNGPKQAGARGGGGQDRAQDLFMFKIKHAGVGGG